MWCLLKVGFFKPKKKQLESCGALQILVSFSWIFPFYFVSSWRLSLLSPLLSSPFFAGSKSGIFSFQMDCSFCFNRHILMYLLSKWKHHWFLFWILPHLLIYEVTFVSYISFSMQQELKNFQSINCFTNFVWLINIHSWTTLSCMFTVMSGWSLD